MAQPAPRRAARAPGGSEPRVPAASTGTAHRAGGPGWLLPLPGVPRGPRARGRGRGGMGSGGAGYGAGALAHVASLAGPGSPRSPPVRRERPRRSRAGDSSPPRSGAGSASAPLLTAGGAGSASTRPENDDVTPGARACARGGRRRFGRGPASPHSEPPPRPGRRSEPRSRSGAGAPAPAPGRTALSCPARLHQRRQPGRTCREACGPPRAVPAGDRARRGCPRPPGPPAPGRPRCPRAPATPSRCPRPPPGRRP